MTAQTKWSVLAISLLLSVTEWAQEFSKAEVGCDYSYGRYAPHIPGSNGHSLNGGGGSLVFNTNQYSGIKADLQGCVSTTSSFVLPPGPNFPTGASANVRGNLFTYLFGPQVKLHTHGVQPFVHALCGGAHSNVYANAFKNISPPGSVVCSFSAAPPNNAFAMAVGGGVNIPVGHMIAVRPAAIDYLYTNFTNSFDNSNQNDSRYSGGVVFTLGGGGSK